MHNYNHAHTKVWVDNTTAVAYLHNGGSMKSIGCDLRVHAIWRWLESRNVTIVAVHLPGTPNVLADFESQSLMENIEWEVDSDIFSEICRDYGQPTIDLFASRINHKKARYMAWRPDPFAVAVNAFHHPWTNEYFYVFPPFRMIL